MDWGACPEAPPTTTTRLPPLQPPYWLEHAVVTWKNGWLCFFFKQMYVQVVLGPYQKLA